MIGRYPNGNVAHHKLDFDNGNSDTVVHTVWSRRNNDFVSVLRRESPRTLMPTNRKYLLSPFSLPLGLRCLFWQGVCQQSGDSITALFCSFIGYWAKYGSQSVNHNVRIL